MLAIAYDPAEDLVDTLIDQDPADPRDGEDPFYAEDQLYQLTEATDWEFAEVWAEFSEIVKHDQRFFGSSTAAHLARLLGEKGSPEANELPTVLLAADQPDGKLFRARRARSAREAQLFLENPGRELTGPPPSEASAGRMNPAGISMFYGALSAHVAIAEVRPSVGGLVVVAEFVSLRPLRLLDLTSLNTLPSTGSVFSPMYDEAAARRKFLRGFHRLVVQPVQPHDEPLEYLPTQAVAEYVRNVLHFDGICFAATQVGALTDVDPYDDEGGVPPSQCTGGVRTFDEEIHR